MAALTIELDDSSLSRVEKLAAARNVPVSEMARRLIQQAMGQSFRVEDLPSATRESLGMLSPMTDEEAAAAVDEHRAQKYGRK